jgi:hypothetical protein
VNPELDQLSGRFSTNRGQVGLLLCRTIDDRERFIARCVDTYRDGRGLIVPLTDGEIIRALEEIVAGEDSPMDGIVREITRQITMA